MTEPLQAGFAGTIWEAVPAERLAHELTTGLGAAPMAEAATAYAELAARLGEAGTEYRAILSVVGGAWGSGSSEDGLAQLAGLAAWFDEVTAAATDNAAAMLQQAAAYELAVLSMPPLAELESVLRSAEAMLDGSPLGAPLAGLLDLTEHRVDALREQAAQAMRTYEAAGEKLAVPWDQERAPAVSAGANLLAEQGRAQAGAPADPAAPQPSAVLSAEIVQPSVPVDGLLAHPLVVPPTMPVGGESLMFAPMVPPGPAVAPAPVVAQPVTAAQTVTTPPLVPPGAPQGTPSSPPPGARSVAADAGDIGEQIVVDAGFSTAPAVLGGVAMSPGAPVAATSEAR